VGQEINSCPTAISRESAAAHRATHGVEPGGTIICGQGSKLDVDKVHVEALWRHNLVDRVLGVQCEYTYIVTVSVGGGRLECHQLVNEFGRLLSQDNLDRPATLGAVERLDLVTCTAVDRSSRPSHLDRDVLNGCCSRNSGNRRRRTAGESRRNTEVGRCDERDEDDGQGRLGEGRHLHSDSVSLELSKVQ
jgi:hypothetical protein